MLYLGDFSRLPVLYVLSFRSGAAKTGGFNPNSVIHMVISVERT